MKVMDKKICFGLIVATRGFFNPVLAGTARKELLELLDELSIDYVIGSADATPHGAVENLEHAKYMPDFSAKTPTGLTACSSSCPILEMSWVLCKPWIWPN